MAIHDEHKPSEVVYKIKNLFQILQKGLVCLAQQHDHSLLQKQKYITITVFLTEAILN